MESCSLGIGMLLNYLGKKKSSRTSSWPALAEFSGLTTMVITALGAIIAILLYNYMNDENSVDGIEAN